MVQYKANAVGITGGAGSGSGTLKKAARGPSKINLIGYRTLAKVLFQAIGDPVPGNQSPSKGKSRTLGPKSEFVINWKINAETRNMMTNLVLETFIL